MKAVVELSERQGEPLFRSTDPNGRSTIHASHLVAHEGAFPRRKEDCPVCLKRLPERQPASPVLGFHGLHVARGDLLGRREARGGRALKDSLAGLAELDVEAGTLETRHERREGVRGADVAARVAALAIPLGGRRRTRELVLAPLAAEVADRLDG